ncbi:transglycosylase family protein [Streptomyces albidoflavus]
MLSGNGRHRRPRQAPAFVVAAGVTGSAIAIPLLGAGSASAADTATWDRLAECESGGAWSTNAGNGYYGGLQVTQELWERHGGLSYAPSADLASRSQQIVVAERILDAEGTAAWATCAPAIGLKQGGESADVNPGVPSASPTAPSGKDKGDAEEKDGKDGKGGKASDEDGKDNKDKKGKGEKGEKGDTTSATPSADPTSIPDGYPSATPDEEVTEIPETPSGAPSATPDEDEDSGGGRHRGGTAAESGSGESREGSGRHASRGDRGDAPDASGAYTVKKGDSLSVIAWLHEVDGGWPALYEANKEIVGDDADHILPGQDLDLGSDPKAEKDRIGR